MNKEKYNKILDDLIEQIGGKEFCLQQTIPENIHKNFINDYRNNNRNFMLEEIHKNFYDTMQFNKDNIIDIEISSSFWNRHIMKIYFYDNINHRIFEFYIKTHKIEEVSLFKETENNEKHFSKSFYAKLKNGNILWEKYNVILEEQKSEEYAEKLKKEKEFFFSKMKKFKFIEKEEFDKLNAIQAPEQYNDSNTRYILNNIFYYELSRVCGVFTFDEGIDIMLNPGFVRLFYEKIVKKLVEK